MSADCFECGEPATENHHVIPKSLGGKATVPLCSECHARVHGLDEVKRGSHRELTMRGLDKKLAEELCAVWWNVFVGGMTKAEASRFLEISVHSIKSRMKRIEEMTDEYRQELFSPIIGELISHKFTLYGD